MTSDRVAFEFRLDPIGRGVDALPLGEVLVHAGQSAARAESRQRLDGVPDLLRGDLLYGLQDGRIGLGGTQRRPYRLQVAGGFLRKRGAPGDH